MKFLFEINKDEGYFLKSYYILLPLQGLINKFCQFYLPTMLLLDFSSNFNNLKGFPQASPGTDVHIQGQLDVTQVRALQCPYFMRNIKSHITYPQLNSNTSLENFSLKSIRDQLMKNPIYLGFKQHSITTEPNSEDNIKIHISLSINEVSIRYNYTQWQKVTAVWMQYLAVFVIFYKIALRLVGYVFDNQYLITWKVEPWKKVS